MSSEPSRWTPKGDPIDDLFCSKVELDNLPLGEEDREVDPEYSAEKAAVIVEGGETTPESGRMGLRIWVD